MEGAVALQGLSLLRTPIAWTQALPSGHRGSGCEACFARQPCALHSPHLSLQECKSTKEICMMLLKTTKQKVYTF